MTTMAPADTARNGTVYVVDDEPMMVTALTRLLRGAGFDTQGFQTPEIFLQFFLHPYRPEHGACVVIDLVMPGCDGLAVQRALAALASPPPFVFLSGRGDVKASVQAMKGGALDFLTKPVDGDALIAAVSNALRRDRQARGARAERAALCGRYACLTQRERQVFAGVVAGQLNKQIALQLGTVEKTVKVHRARVMEKMGAANLAELVRMSARLSSPPRAGDAWTKVQ